MFPMEFIQNILYIHHVIFIQHIIYIFILYMYDMCMYIPMLMNIAYILVNGSIAAEEMSDPAFAGRDLQFWVLLKSTQSKPKNAQKTIVHHM